jgi:phage terminase large subunit-like protein
MDEDEEEAGPLIANALDHKEKAEFQFHWQLLARRAQCAPQGDWRIWMIMAGRGGFGKTRAGAEWGRQIAEADPTARIALVAASLAEARAVMVEGESGLMAVCPPDRMPRFEPSLHRVRFANGAQVQLFSAAEPDGLRGPQHSHASGSGPEGVFRHPSPMPARRLALAHGHGLSARSAAKPE